MAMQAPTKIDRERIRELAGREERTLNERTPKSRQMYERARASLAGGVASSYQLRDPWPIYLERGAGARVRDVDGNDYLDFHNGFGSMVQGHAHPAIGNAVKERYELGRRVADRTAGIDARSLRQLPLPVAEPAAPIDKFSGWQLRRVWPSAHGTIEPENEGTREEKNRRILVSGIEVHRS